MAKALVLSSGGVDSTTCLGLAVHELGADNVVSVSMFYGQKHQRELEAARKLAEYYNIRHYELDLSEAFKYSDCSLLGHSTQEVPEGDYADQIGRAENGKVATFVPFRNGIFLSAAAAIASSLYPSEDVSVYIGAHADDAAGNAYADCSEEFINSMRDAIYTGTYQKVSLVAPFVGCNKSEVVAKGLELAVPYELTTSCYNGRDKACGKCGTCIDRVRAFRSNNAVDPIAYEIDQNQIGKDI